MNLSDNVNRLARPPKMTRWRIILAITVALVADGLQFFLGPLGWAFTDQAIDVVAMLLTSWLVGFHWLLLPTFVMELVPVADEFPTWTVCVITVIALRKQEKPPAAPPPASGPAIDV